jgi:hypothetical protein
MISARYHKSPDVVLREDDEIGALLFHLDTVEVVGLNPVGLLVWQLMDGQHTLEDVVVEVKRRFAQVPDDIGTELATFVGDLAGRSFLNGAPAGDGS